MKQRKMHITYSSVISIAMLIIVAMTFICCTGSQQSTPQETYTYYAVDGFDTIEKCIKSRTRHLLPWAMDGI